MLPKKLNKKLQERKAKNAFRQLGSNSNLVDFSSNDYLGFSQSQEIYEATHNYLKTQGLQKNGATGSRLLSGNLKLYRSLEALLCKFYNCEASLVFNSGYSANIGFFSCVPQRNDIILYDELVHASIRDGITMSHAKSYKFKHNDLEDLEAMILRFNFDKLSLTTQNNTPDIYVVTESVFSMDGDTPNLIALSQLCTTNNLNLVIDEAHAIGVFGKYGEGLIKDLGLEQHVFARIITFGKALGCHGAAVLGSEQLINYLINFSKPFIYTTALSPHSLATIIMAFEELATTIQRKKLKENIEFFKTEVSLLKLQEVFINSESAIQCCIISGNDHIKSISNKLHENGFDVKAILSPTVLKGKERLRFCLHSYNTKQEIKDVLQLLKRMLT
ncbi:pyridoxal phosphate-dependent aminotransferase family protein [Ichthyenterobacterium sp. W332]|uniref:Pyridoxal phosphate-dependent aminotransferase family protein n=1 Tax=Microcosmobacter mediterraneus TaxID=3075607 RepID=A0ABU2YIQ8_9FLAO|nr:pyridoxal phosphate-dependent aminotransferase family protein [Ichthyenterobacterium sp. W332]MDT0557922.1 pyridoxal phosphate-dependent aminotransferase family protein [Ichthyenterobacterium sp. W332]